MKTRITISILLCIRSLIYFSQTDTLHVNYLLDPPFTIDQKGALSGIEIEIINEYTTWLKTKKNMEVVVNFNQFTDRQAFYNQTKVSSKNTIGIGGMVKNLTKAKEIDFTTGYLKNVAFCITNGNAPDIRTKTSNDVIRTLGSMTALTIVNSHLAQCVADIKKLYIKDLKIVEVADQTKILDDIAKNVLNFGYVEAVEFWFYLKNNPQKFLKMQKPLNQDKEQLACIIPKGGKHKALFDEFFDGPGGFKTQKNYRTILEKYVGSYMTQNMAVY
ncbi:MAG: transporter substrate-binding domain-containing protein [Sphingobacteriaceae bacterium]|nr:transporter substrate-binding domain-containing protein [Sphingobacteriaceae bacterium]